MAAVAAAAASAAEDAADPAVQYCNTSIRKCDLDEAKPGRYSHDCSRDEVTLDYHRGWLAGSADRPTSTLLIGAIFFHSVGRIRFQLGLRQSSSRMYVMVLYSMVLIFVHFPFDRRQLLVRIIFTIIFSSVLFRFPCQPFFSQPIGESNKARGHILLPWLLNRDRTEMAKSNAENGFLLFILIPQTSLAEDSS